LNKLEGLKQEFAEVGVFVSVASADSLEKAQSDVEEFGWTVPVAYGLTVDHMRALGLYVSEMPESGHRFSEPGLFVINPDRSIQILGISNAASCRPDLDVVLDGIKGIQARGLPIFGTVVDL
jgi:peroxiredoxin